MTDYPVVRTWVDASPEVAAVIEIMHVVIRAALPDMAARERLAARLEALRSEQTGKQAGITDALIGILVMPEEMERGWAERGDWTDRGNEGS